MLMLIVLALLVATAGFAQTSKDASTLVREVSESALMTKSWIIEGSIKYSALPEIATFTLAMRSPKESRFDQIGGETPSTIICDGSNAWVISRPLGVYTKALVADYPNCAPIVGDWLQLQKTLTSPVLAGRGKFESNGQSNPCQLIRGFSQSESSSHERITRTLCVDLDRKLIVWEKSESKGSNRTYTYSKLDLNSNLQDSAFVFTPPPGSTMISGLQLPVLRPLGSREIPLDPGVSMPKLVSQKEPQYDEDSRRARIEGTAVLYVVIDQNGVPLDLRVFVHSHRVWTYRLLRRCDNGGSLRR